MRFSFIYSFQRSFPSLNAPITFLYHVVIHKNVFKLKFIAMSFFRIIIYLIDFSFVRELIVFIAILKIKLSLPILFGVFCITSCADWISVKQRVDQLGSSYHWVFVSIQQDRVFGTLHFPRFLDLNSVRTFKFLLSAVDTCDTCLWMFSSVSGIGLLNESLELS